MPSERWTSKKLNRLADGVDQLMAQVQQMQLQIVHLSDRVDRTCNSLDRLVNALQNAKSTQPEPIETPANDALNSRMQQMEQQLHQLSDRVKSLERRELTLSPPQLQPVLIEDDDVEDEPDEILWDFLEPSERMNRL